MLQLELIRFDFLPLATVGVIYARDGWTCFAMENVVRPDEIFLPGDTAIPEGLYALSLENTENVYRVMATEQYGAGAQPTQILAGTRPHLLKGAIGIGYGVNLFSAEMTGGEDAMCEILSRLSKDPEAYLHIRHLDARRYHHLQSMKLKPFPKKEG